MSTARIEQERALVGTYLPPTTREVDMDGRHVWLFVKRTQFGIDFQIALYHDADENPPGYVAQLVSPAVEEAWRNPHVGHLFRDGVICLGGSSMRTSTSLRNAFSKSCVWAEGMAAMISGKRVGRPTHFPFSSNNSAGDVR